MLKFLKLKNFQSHKESEFKFHPGINVVCGPSNSGKTSLFRAIIKLWRNRPLGTRQISNFAKGGNASITAGVDDKVISLEFGKDTTYRVETNGKIQEFKSFGANVPDVVSAELNLDPINIQTQLEQHFLIVSSPGDVARELNKITRIEKVDAWVSSLTSKINGENRDVKLLEKQILDHERDLYIYKDLDKFEEDVVHGEYLQSLIDKNEVKAVRLQDYIKQLKYIKEELISVSNDILTLKPLVEELEEEVILYNRLDKQETILTQLVETGKILEERKKFVDVIDPLVQDLQRQWTSFVGLKRKNELLEQIVVTQKEIAKKKPMVIAMTPDVLQLEILIKDLNTVVTDEKDIIELIVQIRKKEDLLTEWKRNKTQNINGLTSCLRLLGKCPTCGETITPQKIDEIIKEF
jgi:exonuclease SbcC